ncbi:hypothetical protein Zm00014a_040968 [Zea mays]|uniref:Uncharacterized protein n=1 Tax=Zea mays TaxID=4577 RepID=A0A3L6DAE8_MAIZE|nr:hypothetical protein Zm00014a_040968 [Zea mays]
MGVELDLSDLAVLRPVQTAAAGDGPDAADTGCVTPTAASSLLPRLGLGGGLLDIDSAACVTPTASPCLLRPATVCPPAPRKPARPGSKRRKRCCRLQRAFFFPVPLDLSTVFVPRGATAPGPADRSSPPPRATKKIRLHVVG